MRAEPHRENRGISITIDGTGDYAASSYLPLEGLHSAPTQDIRWFKEISAGDYIVRAALWRTAADQEVASVTRLVHVTS